jgi:hypothetical protein
MDALTERRKRARVGLHCVVDLKRTGAKPVHGETRNLSCEGFYCLSREALLLGEVIDCVIKIPVLQMYEPDEYWYLYARASVVRIEPLNDNTVGIACRIEDYSVNDQTRAAAYFGPLQPSH